MKMLTSVALSVITTLVSVSAMAERPDFSKTSAARADYDFSKNVSAAEQPNNIQRISTNHDFSKTLAALSSYDFSKNDSANVSHLTQSVTQHDFSKTNAAKESSI